MPWAAAAAAGEEGEGEGEGGTTITEWAVVVVAVPKRMADVRRLRTLTFTDVCIPAGVCIVGGIDGMSDRATMAMIMTTTMTTGK